MTRSVKQCTILVAAIFLAFSVSGTANSAQPPDRHSGTSQSPASTMNGYPFPGYTTGQALLNTLVRWAPAGPEFHESAFEYPIVGADGCTTRERVIIAGASDRTLASPCMVLNPQWVSVWDT